MSRMRVSPPSERVGNVILDSSLGRAPETSLPMAAWSHAVWREGPLPASLLELVRLKNARAVNCVMCKATRYQEAGLEEDKIARLDTPDDSFDERERTALAFATAYLESPGAPDAGLREALHRVFSAEERAHLAMALASFNAMSRCAVSLGGMPDSLPLMSLSVDVLAPA